MADLWWCPKCKKHVDIIVGYNIGLFCMECGKVVEPSKANAQKEEIDYFPYMDDEDEH